MLLLSGLLTGVLSPTGSFKAQLMLKYDVRVARGRIGYVQCFTVSSRYSKCGAKDFCCRNFIVSEIWCAVKLSSDMLTILRS